MRRQVRSQQGFSLAELLVVMAILGLVMAGILNIYMTGTTIALTGQNRAEAQQGARASLQIEEDLRLAGYGFPPAVTPFTTATATSVTFWADLTNSSTAVSAAVNSGDHTLNLARVSGITSGDTVYLINQATSETLTVSSVGSSSVNVSNPGPVNAYPVGTQLGHPRQITYSWDGASTLSRNVGDANGAQPVVTGVSAFALTYYDVNDAVIANPSANLGAIRRVAITMTVQSTMSQNRSTFTLSASGRPRNL